VALDGRNSKARNIIIFKIHKKREASGHYQIDHPPKEKRRILTSIQAKENRRGSMRKRPGSPHKTKEITGG